MVFIYLHGRIEKKSSWIPEDIKPGTNEEYFENLAKTCYLILATKCFRYYISAHQVTQIIFQEIKVYGTQEILS